MVKISQAIPSLSLVAEDKDVHVSGYFSNMVAPRHLNFSNPNDLCTLLTFTSAFCELKWRPRKLGVYRNLFSG